MPEVREGKNTEVEKYPWTEEIEHLQIKKELPRPTLVKFQNSYNLRT